MLMRGGAPLICMLIREGHARGASLAMLMSSCICMSCPPRCAGVAGGGGPRVSPVPPDRQPAAELISHVLVGFAGAPV